MYEHHFQGLPSKIVRKGNVVGLLAVLRDRSLPAMVRCDGAGGQGHQPIAEAL